MKTREIEVWVNVNELHDASFEGYTYQRSPSLTKAKIVFEEEKKITISESEFDKKFAGRVIVKEASSQEIFDKFKEILFLSMLLLFMLPAHAGNIATVSKFINHTAKEQIKNETAIKKIRETAAGECFKKEWLQRKLIQTNSKSNLQVLDSLLAADVSIELEMYKSRISRVNGYTYDSTKRIWLNRKYHDSYGPCSVANNLFHELSHKIGYKHDFKPNKERPFSVPYSINSVMEICCKD